MADRTLMLQSPAYAALKPSGRQAGTPRDRGRAFAPWRWCRGLAHSVLGAGPVQDCSEWGWHASVWVSSRSRLVRVRSTVRDP